ncbi:alpha/beta hydrolase [Paenibacillus sp. y28]|uniref:alpha/beta hydrolase n=1 Tax=Paenibacillus sp. y28 TaxID=3129110 RepID=UPI00301A2E99
MERVYRSTEPFELPGSGVNGETAVLLIHGFTGSPSEFRRLGYYLNDLGYSIHAIRLPGHGTSPEDMLKTRWQHWWGHVRESYDQLRSCGYRHIVVIGHSMGGLLAMKLAAEQQLDGVVSLAAPIYLTTRKSVLAFWLQHFVKYSKKKPSVSDDILFEAYAYTKTPVPCVVSLRKLMRHVKRLLSRVEAPLLIGQGEHDRTVQPRSARYIYERVTASLRRIHYYPETSHAILLDRSREQVYQDIHQFILEVTGIDGKEKGEAI